MKLLLAVEALVGLLLAGPAVAPDLAVTGTVVSSGNASLVISSDEETLYTFVVDTATVLPPTVVEAGSRVTVRYRPLDATHLQATQVVLVKGAEPAPTSDGAEPFPDVAPLAPVDTPTGSVSPALLVAFIGIGIVGGGLVLRALLTRASESPVSPPAPGDGRLSEADRAVTEAGRPFGDRPL